MTEVTRVNYTTRLDADLIQLLAVRANEQGRSVHELINETLRSYINANKPSSAEGAVSAAAKSATDDKARMDWLEMQHVEVRTPLRYGSLADFVVSVCDDDGEDLPSQLRKMIDKRLAKDVGSTVALAEPSRPSETAQTGDRARDETNPSPVARGVTGDRDPKGMQGYMRPIVSCADLPEVNRLANLLMDTWNTVDPNSNVAKYPASYVATFADMAIAVFNDRTHPAQSIKLEDWINAQESLAWLEACAHYADETKGAGAYTVNVRRVLNAVRPPNAPTGSAENG